MPTVTSHSISVVLPAFNEEINLPSVVRETLSVLQLLFSDYELILVNDGSHDHTGAICEELSETSPTIRVVHHPVNRGYGAALRSGFAAATKEWTFFMDADGQFRFEDVVQFIPHLNRYDMVVGYRAPRHDPWPRLLTARIGNFLACRLLPVRVRDINCAFKIFKREKLCFLDLLSEGGFINTELLALAAAEKWTFIEVPVRHFPRQKGVATGAQPHVIGRILLEYIRLRKRLTIQKQASSKAR